MDASSFFDTARSIVGGLVAAAGIAVLIASALGVLRFPDFYTRLHAAMSGHAPGATLVLIGLAVLAHDWATGVRLLLLAALIAAIAPVLGHLLAGAAHAGGLSPITGKYVAPRPGAQKP